MPRRKKVELSVAEKIDAINAEVSELYEALKAKKKELKALEEERAKDDMKALYEAFVNSGKSLEEVLEWLK